MRRFTRIVKSGTERVSRLSTSDSSLLENSAGQESMEGNFRVASRATDSSWHKGRISLQNVQESGDWKTCRTHVPVFCRVPLKLPKIHSSTHESTLSHHGPRTATEVWANMMQEGEDSIRTKLFRQFQGLQPVVREYLPRFSAESRSARL